MSSVAARVSTGVSLGAAVVLLWLADRWLEEPWVVWGVASVLAAFSIVELARMGKLAHFELGFPLGVALVVVALGTLPRVSVSTETFPWWMHTVVAALLAAGYVHLRGALHLRPIQDGAALWAAVLAAWSIPALFGLVQVRERWGSAGLLVVVALAKVGDISGYFIGRSFGRHHPFPKLSPGKTVEGCVASLLGALILGALLGEFEALPGLEGPAEGALLGLILNLAAQAGDLFESWVKRRAAVKDSSSLLGPAGGVLDVVDSLLLAVPAALSSWPALL